MIKEQKILLADDHEMVRNGLTLMLNHQKSFIPNITEAVNGLEVFEHLKTMDFDVILLDISMPLMDGIAVLKKLKNIENKTPVLVLTMHNEESIIKQALDAGATGYILKNSGLEELVKAINTVIKNERYYSNEIAQILFKTKKDSEDIKSNSVLGNVLTKREIQILTFLVREYSSQKIADELFISKRTIEGHRKNIMNKLSIKTTVGLVVFAIKNGYY